MAQRAIGTLLARARACLAAVSRGEQIAPFTEGVRQRPAADETGVLRHELAQSKMLVATLQAQVADPSALGRTPAARQAVPERRVVYRDDQGKIVEVVAVPLLSDGDGGFIMPPALNDDEREAVRRGDPAPRPDLYRRERRLRELGLFPRKEQTR